MIPLGWKLPTYQKVTGLILGHPKTGKTYCENTWPGKTIHAAFDPTGHKALRRKYKVFDMHEAEEAVEYLKEDGDTAVMNYAPSNVSIISSTAYTDSVSLVQKAIMQGFIADANYFVNQSDVVSAYFHDGLTGYADVVRGFIMSSMNHKTMSQPDWGLAISKLLEFITIFTNEQNPVSLIMLAHLQTVNDGNGLVEQPLVFGKQLPGSILQMFDIVFRTNYNERKYGWLTHPTDRLEVLGSRLHDGDDLPDEIPQDWEALLKTIKGGGESDNI